MLGTSPRIQEVFSAIHKVARTDVPVLIVGESGTGKELAARAIHRQSSRREGPFIAINCGAIPRLCSKVSCLATRKEPLLALISREKVDSRQPGRDTLSR